QAFTPPCRCWITADASFFVRKSGIFPNISCVKSRTSLFDQPLPLAREKIAESCRAVRRPFCDTPLGLSLPLDAADGPSLWGPVVPDDFSSPAPFSTYRWSPIP